MRHTVPLIDWRETDMPKRHLLGANGAIALITLRHHPLELIVILAET